MGAGSLRRASRSAEKLGSVIDTTYTRGVGRNFLGVGTCVCPRACACLARICGCARRAPTYTHPCARASVHPYTYMRPRALASARCNYCASAALRGAI